MKQLKQLLTLNRVDYKGCVEKGELLERVARLWIDNNLHKNDSKYLNQNNAFIVNFKKMLFKMQL